MKTIRFRPGQLRPQRRGGFTLVEMMIVVAIIGILVGLALPNFFKARTRARQQLCIENLGQIESAKQVWGLQNQKTDGDTPTEADLIGPSLYIKEMPLCPAAGTYSFNAIGTNATCTAEGHVL